MDSHLYKVYTGEDFNALYAGYHFVKLTKEDNSRQQFVYKEGLNIDTNDFDPNGQCREGGLYFTDINKMLKWLSYGPIIWEVIIPPDAKVYVEENKFKADKFVLLNRMYIEDHECWSDNVFCLEAVKKYGRALQYVKEQTPQICLEAVKNNGLALHYVKIKTPQICLEAVKKHGLVLKHVKEQTPQICLEAVKKYGWALQYVSEEFRYLFK